MTTVEKLEEFDKKLKKACNFKNFKKLVLFANACAGESLTVGNIKSDEWLYFDVLKSLGDDFDYTQLDIQAYIYVWSKSHGK